jgi:hypothetical protein
MVSRDVFFEYSLDILIGLAGVDGERFSRLEGEFYLTHKHLFLDVSGAVVVMIVETTLAGANTPRMF